MKKALSTLMILTLLLTPVLALADSTMRVQGSASVSVSPDYAVLYLGYLGESPDSATAQAQAANAITAIVDALMEKGLEEKDIVTASLNTYPTYSYQEDIQTLRGYRVEHMLAITVRDMDQVGDMLDTALKAGANQANSVEYRSSQEKDVYLRALALAIDDATTKADAMAIATGMWLGSLEEVNEQIGGGVYRYAKESAYDTAAGASIGSTLMAGELEISASVELVYEIR